MGVFASRRITVHADHTSLWEQLRQLCLELFRARPEIFDTTTAAFGAYRRYVSTQITVMADEGTIGMVDHRLPARMAGEHEATGTAKNKRRIAAPIQHDDRLLTARQRLRQEITQIVGENRAPPVTQLCTHIDGTHTRQGLRTDALRHSEKRQFPGERPRIRLK